MKFVSEFATQDQVPNMERVEEMINTHRAQI